MKKKLLLFMALLCTCVSGAWAEDVEIRPRFVSSSDTRTSGECASNLVDANNGNPTGTKWGQSYTNGSTTAWIVVKAAGSVLKSYKLFNANDTETQPNRRWKNWVIEGSNDPNGEWTEIDRREDQEMVTTNFAANEYILSSTPAEYSYYKITINEIMGDGMFQMSDLLMTVERSAVDITFNVRNAAGEVVYTVYDDATPNTTWNAPAVPVDYVTYNTTSFQVGTENAIFETTYESTFPYQFSTAVNPIWYTWKMRYGQNGNNRGYLYYDATNTGGYVRETQNEFKGGGAYYWALVGSEFGFKIINYAQGTGRYLTEGIAFNTTGTEFVARKGEEASPAISNVCFKVKGTPQKYLNDVSGTKLGTWDDAAAAGSVGSQILFEPVEDLVSYFDSEKVYVLKSASNTYLNFTGDGSTATSYRATPTYIKITQTNTGYVFANALNNEQKLTSTHAWNASLTSAGSTWAVAPANDEGVYYVMRRDNGSGGFYLGNRNNTNEGTGVYTDQPNPLPWTISNVYIVDIEGGTDECRVTYTDGTDPHEAANGGFIPVANIENTDNITATDVDGLLKEITIDGYTIKVIYYQQTADYSEHEQFNIQNGNSTTSYVAENLASSSEASAAKYVVFGQGERDVEYNGKTYEAFCLYNPAIKRYVGKVDGADLTTEGNNKFTNVVLRTDAVMFIYVDGDIIPVESIGHTASAHGQLSWNWHGGASATNNMGLYGVTDGNSTWKFVNEKTKVVGVDLEYIIGVEEHLGLGVGQYSFNDSDETLYWEVTKYVAQNAQNDPISINSASLKDAYTRLERLKTELKLNPVTTGRFLRIKASAKNKETDSYASNEQDIYLTSSNSTVTNRTARAAFKRVDASAELDNSTIFYYDVNNNLIGLANGFKAVNKENFVGIGEAGAAGVGITFEPTGIGIEACAYRIEYNNNARSLFTWRDGENFYADGAGADQTDVHYRYFVEEVTEIPVKLGAVSEDGKAFGTVCLPMNAKLSGVKAYAAKAGTDNLILTEVAKDGILPANTPVILCAESNEAITTSIALADSNGDPISGGTSVDGETNQLSGTVEAITLATPVYAISNKYTPVGFYKYKGSYMPGFKAYYNEPANLEVVAFRFSFEDVQTAIRAIDNKNNSIEIYDLNGRQVQKAGKGLYIVNGKKVMFK